MRHSVSRTPPTPHLHPLLVDAYGEGPLICYRCHAWLPRPDVLWGGWYDVPADTWASLSRVKATRRKAGDLPGACPPAPPPKGMTGLRAKDWDSDAGWVYDPDAEVER